MMSTFEKNKPLVIAVASGKGGTGKTTVAVNLARTIRFAHIFDCDVEEPNVHLFLKPKITARQRVEVKVPKIDMHRCNLCRACADFCTYNALAVMPREVLVFPEICHSCGGCMLVCPQDAIREVGYEIGALEKGSIGTIGFTHGILHTGKPVGIPIIKKVKEQVGTSGIAIIDAPPGTSCAMVESVEGSDFCILVTEPTPFGLNDLKLAVEALCLLKIPFGVVINRSGVGNDDVRTYCAQEEIPVVMELPDDIRIARAYARGETILDALPEYRPLFTGLYDRIKELCRPGGKL